MRQAVRITFLFILSALSTAVLAAIAAVFSAISLAATALIVPGTGTPDANVVADYRQNFVDRYSFPFNPACTSDNGCLLDGIDYPASFFPLVIFDGWCEPGRCETWNASVGAGVDGLYTGVENTVDPELLVLGYSQGGAVVSNTLRRIQQDNPALLDKIDTVVMIGNAYNPDGGIFTRLGFLPTIPFLDVTFGPATPVDTGVEMFGIGFEFDPVMYAPHYWGNPLAMLNAVAAFDNVHGFYLTPNGNGPTDSIAYGYTEQEIADILATGCPGDYCRLGSEGNEYYMIPAKSLPIMNLLTSLIPEQLRPLVQPIVELVSPVLRVLINLGYDWSGDPDQTRYLSILPFNPFQNWLQVGVDLVEAVVEGVENAFGGGSMMIAPPSGTTELASFSATAAELDSQPQGELQQSGGGVEELQSQGEPSGQQLGDLNVVDQQLVGQDAEGGGEEQPSEGLGLEVEELQNEIDGQEIEELANEALNEQPDARIEDQEDGTIDADGGSVSLSFSPGQPESAEGEQGADQQVSVGDPGPAPAAEESTESPGDEQAAA
ncbi:PE-PPE domain-containing protein [Mycobacterium sp. IDR2000157661]|uniref:PE-PPE domain-containing protein n=1 Tax=Mycobacterium sp. IDR2000157661 TaxID=2867005 RepID=UPI001EEBEFD3|nr:PE-PPE domain-containing protein [Mycobacterium sp. IDR2000157661]ULE33941.1 PE-PPE domain-containing protein [Mycobacterium sp. IDR2000157661]